MEEFADRAIDAPADRLGVELQFKWCHWPVPDAFIEGITGQPRHDCLTTEVFLNVVDALEKIEHPDQDDSQYSSVIRPSGSS
ncbi:MAG TPA: hypothetical protein VH601_02520 [Bryobacteraceae bacterium]|jgi:hypothetical protein